MPNRIIKESIHTSDRVSNLTDFQFRLWVGLITYVDDYGRGDARAAIIRGAVFPLREGVTAADIDEGLRDLERAGCILLYEVDGKPYLCFPNWEAHQRIQTKRSKFPPPDSTVDDREIPPESESESESISESELESESESSMSAKRGFAQQAAQTCEEVIFLLPVNGGGEYGVTSTQIEEWGSLYPAVDVAAALRAMKGWLLANPTRQKTKGGLPRFINAWLAREQDRGARPRGGGGQKNSKSGDLERIEKFMAWNEAQLYGSGSEEKRDEE